MRDPASTAPMLALPMAPRAQRMCRMGDRLINLAVEFEVRRGRFRNEIRRCGLPAVRPIHSLSLARLDPRVTMISASTVCLQASARATPSW